MRVINWSNIYISVLLGKQKQTVAENKIFRNRESRSKYIHDLLDAHGWSSQVNLKIKVTANFIFNNFIFFL